MMNKLMAMFALVALAACGQGGSDDGSKGEEGVGAVQLALTAVDDQQVEYRLRNATFNISGYSYELGEYVNQTVSSEDDPKAQFIHTRVLAGSYTVELTNTDWYFERLTENGYERVEKSVLLGQAYQSVYVYQGSTTNVSFRFGVDGDELDFLGGDIDIGITVEHPQDAGANP